MLNNLGSLLPELVLPIQGKKKKAKYTDAKKTVRPRESLENVKVSQVEWHGNWWLRVAHELSRRSTFDLRVIQNQFIIREDADIW
eukprot:6455550-Amphidinium_carterae.1